MAYVSGTAATFAELVAGIRNACTANGWTLSGEVLHKGTVYQRVRVNGNFIDSQGGTGIDGSNKLTGAAASAARIGSLSSDSKIPPITFPASYQVFISTDPDEVMVVVSYGADLYQWLAWGKSSVALPGTGGWFSGTMSSSTYTDRTNGIYMTSAGGTAWDSLTLCPALFWADQRTTERGEFVNHGIGAAGWDGVGIIATQYRQPMDAITPNAYNNQAVLLPIQCYTTAYGSSKVALVVDVQSIRAISINNLNPGEIITLGPDRWKVFPWYKKTTATNMTQGDSTGKYGFAVRYDGP